MTWVLVVAFVIWTALCVYLGATPFSYEEVADDRGAALAYAFWALSIAVLWLFGVALLLFVMRRRR